VIHIFDPEVLHDVAESVLDKPMNEKVELIRAELARIYPGHVQDRVEWIFNIAGGALGQMAVLHASISEYVIIFGSPIGTEGYSGRFQADDYFIILEGEQWVFGEGDFERTVYHAGEMHHMPRGQARGYRMPDRCFALEYARGWIPLMLPFGLADSFTSTVDPKPVVQTFKVYTKAVLGEWLTLARERGYLGGRAKLPVPGPRASAFERRDEVRTGGSISARLSK
jgi:C-8 sterol isomerase